MSGGSLVFVQRCGAPSSIGTTASAGTCEVSCIRSRPWRRGWSSSQRFIAGHLTRRFGCDGELEWLDVVAECRRTGVAGELWRALATWFAGRQARRICVDVDPQNAPARAFYRKHGAQDLNPHWLVWPDTSVVATPRAGA